MKIVLRCLPGYERYLPKPVLARGAMPDWLRAMPATAAAEVLAGADIRTVKHCPPFLDAMRAGVLFPLATELRVEHGTLSWEWDLPRHPSARLTRSPVGVHPPEQLAGAPWARPGQFAVKFTNFWAVELPAGFSLLVTHPHGREDLPFRTLSGLVDADRFTHGFVHFPAIWTDPDFTGTLAAGTPVAQAIPVRREQWELTAGEMDEAELSHHLDLAETLQEEPGLYRRRFRAERGGA